MNLEKTETLETTEFDPVAWKKAVRKPAGIAGLLLILFYGGVLLTGLFLPHLTALLFPNLPDADYEAAFTLLAYIFQYPVIVGLLLVLFHVLYGKQHGIVLKDAFCKPAASFWNVLKWALIAIGVTYTSAYLSNFILLFLEQMGVHPHTPEMSSGTTLLAKITDVIAITLFAPFFEEMLFRGSIYRSNAKTGVLPAAILCGILFGLWHANVEQTLYTGVMGFCVCLVYAKTKSLWAPILMHFLMNSVGALQLLFLGDLDLERIQSGDADYMMEHLVELAPILCCSMLMLALTGVGALLLIIEIIQHPETFRFEKGERPTGETLRCMFTSPLLVIGVLFLLTMTVLRAVGIY